MPVLQPKHTKLKPAEAEELLRKLNVSRFQLPHIKRSDPALPADSKSGDVIAIERKSNSGKAVYYRVVV